MIEIFKKFYDEDSLADLQRDLVEALNPDYNSEVLLLPEGGAFEITITWRDK